ncbi:LuxR C-terminal-related transcriptional regulator [Pseudonocardia asaccharolytica]|uniref:LuxR C-terminal-related transcriptional regulator n=1 Tax=Pseudonocardia asaccharolytica TaxID=54010 RepID=UPI00056BB985|nr:LuxR C-terminal-related transcriptional regulator [Pseudonocardia asaccharolytica]
MDSETTRLLQATEAARERGDWHTVHRLLRDAYEGGTRLPAAALAHLGLAAWWLGEVGESLEIGEECHRRFLAEGDEEAAAANAVDVAVTWILRGDVTIGSGWLGRARRLQEGRPPGLAHGLLRYVECLGMLGEADMERAADGGRELQRLGAELGESTLTALGLAVEGVAEVRLGHVANGLSLLDEAMLPVVAGDVQPEYAGGIYCDMIAVCHDLADPQRARHWTETTELWCAQFSSAAMYLSICRVRRVQLLNLAGAWSEAEREALQVCLDVEGINASVVAEAHCQLAEIHRLRGELDQAARALEQVRVRGGNTQPEEARLALARGAGDEAVEGLRLALARSGGDRLHRAPLLLAQAEVGYRTSDPSAAAAARLELAEISASFPSPGMRAWAAHAHGMALLAAGDHEAALAPLRTAVGGYEAMSAPYAAAQARLLLADCLRDLGHDENADTEDLVASRSLADLGATTSARRAPPGGLTRREAEVLGRVTEGETNRQVAAALHISEKTVGRHLSNIYLKLGVASRTAASAWAHDHGVRAPRASS